MLEHLVVNKSCLFIDSFVTQHCGNCQKFLGLRYFSFFFLNSSCAGHPVINQCVFCVSGCLSQIFLVMSYVGVPSFEYYFSIARVS
jgi:hypothetical protein